MSDNLHSVCRDLDPEEVERLMTNKKHAARKKIIRKFLFKTYLNRPHSKDSKQIKNKSECMLITNSYNLCKLLIPLSVLFSFFSYKYFFTGIYEFRSLYLNTKSIPFAFKILFAAGLGYLLFDRLWIRYVYNEDIYELAVRELNKL